MKRKLHNATAFTLVEVLMSGSIATLIGGVALYLLNATMLLSAKNLSVNATNNSSRSALDRLERTMQQADSMPTLINTSGAAATSPAAGIRFDHFIGSPYVLTVPAAGLPATTTALTLTRSTHALASPPLPQVGDIVAIDSFPVGNRPLVTSVVVGPVSGGRQAATVQLAAPIGRAIPGTSTGSVLTTARLIREVAFIVVTVGTQRQLRYFGSYQTAPNSYLVVTDQVGMQTADATPFSIVQSGGKSFINTALRLRSAASDRRLARYQNDEFNTFMRLDWLSRPKVSL